MRPRGKPIVINTGVYAIRNTTNGKVYVGSTTQSFKARWQGHRNQLIGQRHYNKHLQAAWNAYGGSAFEFEILERCRPKWCIEQEQHWIDWYKAHDRKFGYNGRPRAENNLGKKFGPHSPEHKSKVSASLKIAYIENPRPPMSAETREKISVGHTGKVLSKEHREALSEAGKGRVFSAETRAKIGASNSIALKGKPGTPHTPESKAKLSAAHTGKVLTEEHKANLSAAHKGRPWSDARRAAANKNKEESN